MPKKHKNVFIFSPVKSKKNAREFRTNPVVHGMAETQNSLILTRRKGRLTTTVYISYFKKRMNDFRTHLYSSKDSDLDYERK